MASPRVLHVITGLGTGGAEASLVRVLAHSRDASAHTVLSLTSKGARANDLTALGVTVQALGLSRGSIAPQAAYALRQQLRSCAPDVVHGWMYHGNLAASVASWFAGVRAPVIWGVRHALDAWDDEPQRLRALIRISAMLSKSPDAIVYNSARAARQHALRGYGESGALVIPNGVCTTRFQRNADGGAAVRASAGIPGDAIVIGMLARVHPLKDHQMFLAGAMRMVQTNPRAWFLLAGTGTARADASPDGNLDALVANAINAAPALATRLVRLGERSDVSAVLGACDIVSVTSKSEGSPNAAAEAMACGVPCVVTDVGDAADLVGDCGRVVASGDLDALVSAWQELADDAALRTALGDAAQRRIRTRYTASIEAAAFADLWQRVATGHGKARRAA